MKEKRQTGNDRANRAYGTTVLPTLRDGMDAARNRDLLTTVYNQTCQSWRQLVDVRFKLLALVPTLSLGSLAIVINTDGRHGGLPFAMQLLFALTGLAVTIGLRIYDARNSELHDDLIDRARKIEEELGIHTGAFLGRLKPRKSMIQHGRATSILYGAAIFVWVAALVFAIARTQT